MRPKFLLVALIAMFASACRTKPIESVDSANTEVTVDVVSRFNGITLYRVHVDDRYVYVADRGDNAIQRTQFTVPCGKSPCPESVVSVTSRNGEQR